VDYVVFGTGYGATLMLLGWALRTFGPGARYQDPGDGSVMGGDAILARISWRRFASALGAVIVTAGVFFILVTVALILINPGDETGALVALICLALILLAVAIWTWLYVGRYGTHGILPERLEEHPASPTRGTEANEPAPAMALASRGAVETVGTIEPYEHIDEEPGVGEDYDGFVAEADDDTFEDDELESRYAKFLLHHPDEVVTVQRIDEDASSVDVEDKDPAVTDPDRDELRDEAEAPDVYDVPPTIDTANGSLAATIPDYQPVPDDESQVDDKTHISLDEDHRLEDVQPEDSSTTPEVIDLETDEESLPRDTVTGGDESHPSARGIELEDTEEGRAEALRRLHAWQPPDTDEKNT
jgi:hypothetical protein